MPSDRFDQHPAELATFYAEDMARDLGPAMERHLEWKIRDARAAGDRRRVRFWESVRDEGRRRRSG